MTSPETALFEFLQEKMLESGDQADLVVQATAYQSLVDVSKCIRIGNAETVFGPGPVGGGIQEWDVDLTLQILYRVGDAEKPESFCEARDGVTDVAKWVVDLFNTDSSLGSRVCGMNLYKALRGWAKIQTASYAVILLPIRVNPMSYE